MNTTADRGRHPAIARACFHLNWILLALWAIYLAGPDAVGLVGWERDGTVYGLFTALFFVVHFVVIANGIIALFVVIIEVHGGRAVRGFRSVLVSLGLPIVSFLYFTTRYLLEARRFMAD
jgi:hypothetical protein